VAAYVIPGITYATPLPRFYNKNTLLYVILSF